MTQMTFLKISAEIVDLATNRRNQKMCHLLLRAIVASHDDDELSLVRSNRWTKHGAGEKVTVRKLSDQSVQLSSQKWVNLYD
jgi:hypothetical protein